MNDPNLLVLLPVIWPFLEGKKMLEKHTIEFICCFIPFNSKDFAMSHFFFVGIIALLVQIKGRSCVLSHHDDVLFSSSIM